MCELCDPGKPERPLGAPATSLRCCLALEPGPLYGGRTLSRPCCAGKTRQRPVRPQERGRDGSTGVQEFSLVGALKVPRSHWRTVGAGLTRGSYTSRAFSHKVMRPVTASHMRSPLPLCQATVIPFRQCPLASFRIQAPTMLVLLWLLIDDARPWEGLTSLREAGALALPCESRSIFCSSWTVFKVPRKEGEDLWGGSCPPCSDAGSSRHVCLTLTVPCAVIPLEKAWKNSGKFLWKNGKLWKIPTTSYCRDPALR